MSSGYLRALEAAGAVVHGYEEFGSYQGDWWAHLTYNGVTGYVNGAFGSCSCCDAFEGEFYYIDSHEADGVTHWTIDAPVPNCVRCDCLHERLKEFGERYLNDIMSFEDAMAEASKHLEWDCEAREMVDWLEHQKVEQNK